MSDSLREVNMSIREVATILSIFGVVLLCPYKEMLLAHVTGNKRLKNVFCITFGEQHLVDLLVLHSACPAPHLTSCHNKGRLGKELEL